VEFVIANFEKPLPCRVELIYYETILYLSYGRRRKVWLRIVGVSDLSTAWTVDFETPVC
jgi:hypothetical protein